MNYLIDNVLKSDVGFSVELTIAILVGIVLVVVNAIRMEAMYQEVPNVGSITFTVCLTLFLDVGINLCICGRILI